MEGFVQGCSISSALALEIPQSCIKSCVWKYHRKGDVTVLPSIIKFFIVVIFFNSMLLYLISTMLWNIMNINQYVHNTLLKFILLFTLQLPAPCIDCVKIWWSLWLQMSWNRMELSHLAEKSKTCLIFKFFKGKWISHNLKFLNLKFLCIISMKRVYNSFQDYPDNKVHGANMGPTWALSAPDGPHVGPMNFAIRVLNLWWKIHKNAKAIVLVWYCVLIHCQTILSCIIDSIYRWS